MAKKSRNGPSWLDRAVAWVSPAAGAKRLAWKQSNDILLKNWAYDSDGHGPQNYGWRVVNDSAEYTDKWARDNVRARARDLERNSDLMNATISAFVRNVYGPGFKLQAKVGDGDPTDYTETNKLIEKMWQKWCKKQYCDITATQDFDELIRMCVTRKKVDGGIIIVKRFTSRGFVPFTLQIFEVDELDDLTISPKYVNDVVVDGIEFDKNNKAVGYYIRQYSTDGLREITPVFIKAENVIFYYTKRRPSQLREMSDMTPTINRIRDVNQYMESVSVKERILACLSIFIKKINPGTSGIGRGSSLLAPKNDGNTVSAYDGKSISPGMMMELQPGEDIASVAPSGQTQDASTYIKLQERMLSAGQGMSYEAVSRDMSETNYSSARQAIIEDERTYKSEQNLLIGVMNEIYETFVISLYLTGIIDPPDFFDNIDKYLAHKWIMPSKQWIDPTKEASANKIALASGQRTFQQMAAESGSDWKDQIDEMAESLKYAKAKGIDLGGVIFEGKQEIPDGSGSTESPAE